MERRSAYCEARDTKGLYKKARAGEIPNFTGVDSPYEPPLSPDLRLAAGDRKVDDLADQVIDMLRARGSRGSPKAPRHTTAPPRGTGATPVVASQRSKKRDIDADRLFFLR